MSEPKRKRGRPRKPPSEKAAWVGKVRAPMLLGAELEAEAARAGLSLSAYVLELVSEARAERRERWRKDGQLERDARARRAAADAATVALTKRKRESTLDHSSASQPVGTGPGVREAGRRIFAARESHPEASLGEGPGHLFGPRKATPPEVGTVPAREAQRKRAEAATSALEISPLTLGARK